MTLTSHEQQTRNNELLSFHSVEKSFFGVKVLKQVSFTVRAGTVLGLVGENGAGKSTLMNILGGDLQPETGGMQFRAAAYVPRNPREAQAAGIGFVHQELNVFPNLSIAENLFLTALPSAGPLIRRAELQGRAAELLRRIGLALAPDTLVERLSAGERQLVEIARALSFDARLIILDEPTTSLSAREAERLFSLIRQLRGDGRSIIYISHALGDVLRLCDEIVVLRDGAVVGAGAAADFDLARLVTLMVGRELKQLFPERSSTRREDFQHQHAGSRTGAPMRELPLLEVRGLTQPGIVRDISFTLRRGEVIGIAGLIGAGRSELARILFGLDSYESGTIKVLGEALRGSPRRRIKNGLALLTESRREDGLCVEASVADNLALVTLPRHTRTPARLIDRGGLRAALARLREAVRLQPHLSDDQPARTLSGGNQQKVVFAKWLLASPQVLILDEPTRGIDVGAKSEIYQLILDRADAGCGVLVISSEIEELTGICDRILVMNRGRITADLSRAQFDRERILRAALPDEVDA
jgi:ribose transport system ATP-binding protein